MYNKTCIFVILFLTFGTHAFGQKTKAEMVHSGSFKRLYRINDSIYRSEQPKNKGFIELENNGLRTVLNLRRSKDDIKKARHTDLILEHIRLKSKAINENDILEVLKVIKSAKKPILIHCWHGSDRTGVAIAAYRMIFENWSAEEAIEEFRSPEFGYHENWYPNLIELLNGLNIEKLRYELGLEI